jgi:hypothetical protein
MRRGFRDNYLSIEQLDETDNCIAQRLNLSRENFVGRETSCSANFMWRGECMKLKKNNPTIGNDPSCIYPEILCCERS